MTELDNNNVKYKDEEANDRLLDALPSKWEIYLLMIKGNEKYKEWNLEEVIGKLTAYDLNLQKKETGFDQVQDLGMYFGKKSSSNIAAG